MLMHVGFNVPTEIVKASLLATVWGGGGGGGECRIAVHFVCGMCCFNAPNRVDIEVYLSV